MNFFETDKHAKEYIQSLVEGYEEVYKATYSDLKTKGEKGLNVYLWFNFSKSGIRPYSNALNALGDTAVGHFLLRNFDTKAVIEEDKRKEGELWITARNDFSNMVLFMFTEEFYKRENKRFSDYVKMEVEDSIAKGLLIKLQYKGLVAEPPGNLLQRDLDKESMLLFVYEGAKTADYEAWILPKTQKKSFEKVSNPDWSFKGLRANINDRYLNPNNSISVEIK